MTYLLHFSRHFKCLICINSCGPHHTPGRLGPRLSLLYRWKNWGIRRLRNLAKASMHHSWFSNWGLLTLEVFSKPQVDCLRSMQGQSWLRISTQHPRFPVRGLASASADVKKRETRSLWPTGWEQLLTKHPLYVTLGKLWATLFHLILLTALWGRWRYHHFRKEETGSER